MKPLYMIMVLCLVEELIMDKDIEITKVRELSYEDATKEINDYLTDKTRPVPIFEVAEKLRIDIDMIIHYMHGDKERIKNKYFNGENIPIQEK